MNAAATANVGGHDADSGRANNGHAYLLSPIPEPETYAMLLAGLGLLGFIARRNTT